jgi:hypothetical protein
MCRTENISSIISRSVIARETTCLHRCSLATAVVRRLFTQLLLGNGSTCQKVMNAENVALGKMTLEERRILLSHLWDVLKNQPKCGNSKKKKKKTQQQRFQLQEKRASISSQSSMARRLKYL